MIFYKDYKYCKRNWFNHQYHLFTKVHFSYHLKKVNIQKSIEILLIEWRLSLSFQRNDQLYCPEGISVDDQNRVIYIADRDNHRIVEWRLDTNKSRIVAGGNGQGNQLNQFSFSIFLFNDDDHTLYISDTDNHRVMKWQWSRTREKSIERTRWFVIWWWRKCLCCW